MRFEISGLGKISGGLKKFAEGKALKVAALYIKEQERKQTEIGRDYQGRMFTPYKKSSVRDRKLRGYRVDKVNLRRTGSLRDSRYYDSTNKELRYGYQTEEIAGYLQDGTRSMKARQFVGISKLDIPEIEKRIVEALEDGTTTL